MTGSRLVQKMEIIQPKGEPNKPNPPTHLGRSRLFYPPGDEGGAGVL